MRREGSIYPCIFKGCTSVFARPDRLRHHIKIHTEEERAFICSYQDCSKSYHTSSHLKRHEATHEPGFRCTKKGCNMVMKTKATLKKHFNCVHHEKPKTYKCPQCDSEFNKHNWLKTHIAKEHTNELPWLCPEKNCGKRFLHPSKLKRHMKIHEGYTCTKPDCGEKFQQWTLYVKHFKHFHPVVHKCSICEKEFSLSNNRDAHEESHKERREVYMCQQPDCSKYYLHKRNLDAHLKSYHEQRPFNCPEDKCCKAFKTEEDLKRHSSIHDPTKPLRKKKKKKEKLSFAAKLAGIVLPKDSKEQKEESSSKDESACDTTALTDTESNLVSKTEDDISAMQIMEKILACCGTNVDREY